VTRAETWLQHVSNLLVGGTGVVYGWMRYAVEPEDEFALVNHPWQPDAQHLHVLVAPLLVFAVGLIWSRHVWTRIRAGFRPRRPTGLVLAASLVPMIASGYLLQTAVEEAWRTAWIVVHVAASGLWIAGYLVHQLSPRGAGALP
jgi:hypothetical protein